MVFGLFPFSVSVNRLNDENYFHSIHSLWLEIQFDMVICVDVLWVFGRDEMFAC